MKTINIILFTAATLTFAACSSSKNTANDQDTAATNTPISAVADTALTGKLSLPQTVGTTGAIETTFIVYNKTDSVKKFLKWHTPFEPLSSKYLDITSANGEEAQYMGPMAKRMMPPPADSYISINPGDSLVVKFDLRKGYDLSKPGNYNIRYNAEGMSGIKVTDSVKLTVKP